jgi:hypothetical protein
MNRNIIKNMYDRLSKVEPADCSDQSTIDDAATMLLECWNEIAARTKQADEMQKVLQVIHTWASVPGALNAQHVQKLTAESFGL